MDTKRETNNASSCAFCRLDCFKCVRRACAAAEHLLASGHGGHDACRTVCLPYCRMLRACSWPLGLGNVCAPLLCSICCKACHMFVPAIDLLRNMGQPIHSAFGGNRPRSVHCLLLVQAPLLVFLSFFFFWLLRPTFKFHVNTGKACIFAMHLCLC